VPGRFDAVFDCIDCALCDPEINDLLALVRAYAKEKGIEGYHGRTREGILRHLLVRSSEATGEWLVVLVVRDEHPDLQELADRCRTAHPRIAGFLLWVHEGLATVARADREILLFGKGRIIERLCDVEFELSASSFFQTNTQAAAGLLVELRRFVPQVETILDLFCGVGTLGLGLARHCNQLLGVESVEAAVIDARRNAERNGITDARFELAKAEDWLPHQPSPGADLVVVDPPRAGLHPKALRGLIGLSPPRIVYVSCNPATLARDLAALISVGYRAEKMRILDLFPHTPHVETIVRLLKEPNGGA
jgi:23S rRNA (uracil-5-)-methyltransferase RumA